MGIFREISSGFRHLRRGGRNALRDSFATAASFFRSDRGRGGERRNIYRLVRLLFSRGGALPPEVEPAFRSLLEEVVPDINAAREWNELEETPVPDREALIAALRELAPGKRDRCIAFPLAMAERLDAGEEIVAPLREIALGAGMAEEKFEKDVEEIRSIHTRREQMLRSSTGIIAALIVIGVFILTATLLRAVIFGLIAAYLLLPLERYFEKSWRRRRGLGYWLGLLGGCLSWLPVTIASSLKRRIGAPPTREQLRKKKEQRIISRAVGQTVFAFLIAALLFVGAISSVTTYYLRSAGNRIKTATLRLEQGGESGDVPHAAALLQQARRKLLEVPFMKYIIEKVELTLKDEQARQELISMIVRRSGGVFSFLFSAVGFIGALIVDLLLTVFFTLLFLMKMAEFKSAGGGGGGAYAVRTILASHWLPNVSESTLDEAQRILSGVFARLRIWVRGYLMLVLIDSTVYTVLFGLLDVPYFPVLGILAGCGILLPYVGPVCSCAVTLLVTWLAGDATLTQLILVGCCYLLYNGVIEQFILYPLVIGESLGLSTLETIIVVLLGAIFAGIPGMILALPAASVIKYLVPRIYRCWDGFGFSRKNGETPESPSA